MSDVVLYTVLFGARGSYRTPPEIPFDFRIFTDNAEVMKKEPRAIYAPLLVPGDIPRSVRLVKAMPQLFLPGYKTWIWQDNCFDIKLGADLEAMVSAAGQFGAFRHPQRDCIYAEAKICIDWNLDDPDVIARQMKKYRDEYRHPEKDGLAAGGLLVRQNNPKICQFNVEWWTEIALHSRRDQLSLNVVARHIGLPITYLALLSENPWFTYLGYPR